MACGLRVSANKPPAIQAIEMLFSISDKEPRGVAQKNDNLTRNSFVLIIDWFLIIMNIKIMKLNYLLVYYGSLKQKNILIFKRFVFFNDPAVNYITLYLFNN